MAISYGVTTIGMMQKKIAEAEAAFASGMKAEKAGVSCGFWGRMVGGGSVDWDLAAADYERAATGFKVAKEHSRAIDAFERAAHAQGNLSEGEFMASKHLESAAFLALELKRHAAAASLYEQSATVHLTVCASTLPRLLSSTLPRLWRRPTGSRRLR